MNHETHSARSPELSRKQKLVRRFVPLALVASGAGVGYGLSQGEHEPRAESYPAASVSVRTAVELGNSETGWGHGAAEKAIHLALRESLQKIAVLESDGSGEPLDIDEVLAELPVYDQAEAALEMAHYDEMLPDAGDTLSVELTTTLDSKDKAAYEITDAQINDLKNNQD